MVTYSLKITALHQLHQCGSYFKFCDGKCPSTFTADMFSNCFFLRNMIKLSKLKALDKREVIALEFQVT